jgi:3-oxoacyl-[acyl-carrier protein] reductase
MVAQDVSEHQHGDMATSEKPVVLISGAGRRNGIAAAVASGLAVDGWNVAYTYWKRYDDRVLSGSDSDGPDAIASAIRSAGGECVGIEADLELIGTPSAIFDQVVGQLGNVSALVIAHCESVDSDLLGLSIESFDRHYAVNVRATWLLMQEFGRRFVPGSTGGRIVTLTSDHAVGNVAYGATKAAADRVTQAAAYEFAHLGITANALNPGPINTGWMTEAHLDHARTQTPIERLGEPKDAADMVRFLCSPQGGWVTAQLLYSNGGFKSSIP